MELSDENYLAYGDCLNRMGAWDELFDFFADLQARHFSESETVLPLQPRTIASTLVLALQIANTPHLQTLRAPSADDYQLLESRIQELVREGTWEEVGRLLRTGEYWTPPSSVEAEFDRNWAARCEFARSSTRREKKVLIVSSLLPLSISVQMD